MFRILISISLNIQDTIYIIYALLCKNTFSQKDVDAICMLYVIFSKVALRKSRNVYNTFKQIADSLDIK